MPEQPNNDNESPSVIRKPIGAPSIYTPELAHEICALMAQGHGVRAIGRMEGMPDAATIFRWAATKEDFREQYTQARELGMEQWAEQCLEIADDDSRDLQPYKLTRTTKNGSVIEEEGVRSDNTATQRDRLKVDSRKWILAKLAPRKYGDKVLNEVSGPNGQAIVVNVVAKIGSSQASPSKLAPHNNNSVIPQSTSPHSHTIELKNNNDVFSLAPAQASQPQALAVQSEPEGRGPGPVMPIKTKLGND